MMELSQHGTDTYVGAGPTYPWGGLFGGQILAQSLKAAAETVGSDFRVHSLHGYFIRKGDASQPIRFEVDRLRDGRSFVTRAVVARQSMGAILNMSASFQLQADTEQVVTATPPSVAGPHEVANHSWSDMFQRRPVVDEPGRQAAWMIVDDVRSDDPTLAACALTFVSDNLATPAVRSLRQHSEPGKEWVGVSLDHAIWFQTPVDGKDWQLHLVSCDALRPPRGLATGHIFSRAGDQVATFAQEVLVRPARPPS